MDVIITRTATPRESWDVTDLLGRDLGKITAGPEKMMFKIQASSGTRLFGVSPGPYATLEHALDQISRHVQGQCRVLDRKEP